MLFRILTDIFFPPLCFGCGHYEPSYLCDSCFAAMPIFSSFFCPICQRRLPEARKICHQESPYLLAAATDYKNQSLQQAIYALKYQGAVKTLAALERPLSAYLQKIAFSGKNWLLLPIPLAASRQQKRGFNQAELIGRLAADILKMPFQNDALRRVKETPQQSLTKNNEERLHQIKDCFEVARPEITAKKNIILVDDVFTSGATLAEASRVLKNNGARKIVGLVVAKAR